MDIEKITKFYCPRELKLKKECTEKHCTTEVQQKCWEKLLEESSQDKQKRLNCCVTLGIDNWDCYKDCAFWDGEKCTNYEEESSCTI